jgi:MerR family transcriptional regulator, light-induced transcriptional regulator
MHCMIELNGEDFEEILDDYINANGIDKTITYLVFPFLEKTGILWLTDHIRIAQEHLVSNIIRQKLIMGIQNVSNLQIGTKTVVMYLPAGEHHELGLLYMRYLLKIRGTKIIYLGCDTPFDELEFVVKFRHPDFVYTHLTSVSGRFNLDKYLEQVKSRLGVFTFVFSGRIVQSYHNKTPGNVHFKNSMKDVINELSD